MLARILPDNSYKELFNEDTLDRKEIFIELSIPSRGMALIRQLTQSRLQTSFMLRKNSKLTGILSAST